MNSSTERFALGFGVLLQEALTELLDGARKPFGVARRRRVGTGALHLPEQTRCLPSGILDCYWPELSDHDATGSAMPTILNEEEPPSLGMTRPPKPGSSASKPI